MSYKLLSYLSSRGPRAGLLIRDRVFDASDVTANPQYSTVVSALEDWRTADGVFEEIAAKGASTNGALLSQITLLAPLLYPGQMFAAGANYQDHIDEMSVSKKVPSPKTRGGRPWFFSKASRSTVIGHGSTIPLPSHSQQVDWEIELAVVIGKTAKNVPAALALEHVAGYTIADDLSARDFILRPEVAPQSPFRFDWISHKSFDGACPMGPWITPSRDIPDPQSLGLKLWVDGVEMQSSNTKHMIYTVAEQIAELSSRLALHPGDVILTGTPAGVGISRGVYLQPKQRVRLWIENIGELDHGFC